jgi:hypothetical protein
MAYSIMTYTTFSKAYFAFQESYLRYLYKTDERFMPLSKADFIMDEYAWKVAIVDNF